MEISGENRQTYHFCRNHRCVPVLKVEYQYSNSFLVLRILSIGTESRVLVLKVVFCPEDVEYRY